MTDEEKKLARLERRRQQQKEYRLANPDKARAANARRNKEWRARNPEHVKALNRAKTMRHYYKNLERVREGMRERANKRYHKYTKQQRSERHLRHNYGLTLDDFNAMLERQGHSCACCGTKEPAGYGWMVDHCHAKKHVRGILCHHCNAGLGHARDDIEVLRKWIDYLGR